MTAARACALPTVGVGSRLRAEAPTARAAATPPPPAPAAEEPLVNLRAAAATPPPATKPPAAAPLADVGIELERWYAPELGREPEAPPRDGEPSREEVAAR